MSISDHTLLDVARAALQSLNHAGRAAVGIASASPEFGKAQMAIARAGAFEDAMLAALRARINELKAIVK